MNNSVEDVRRIDWCLKWVKKTKGKVLKLIGARKPKRTRFEVCKDIFEVLMGNTGRKKPPCDIRIRKVKVLQGKAKEEAKKKGLNPDDLVIVTNGVNIEKIVGDPVSYLLKRAKEAEDTEWWKLLDWSTMLETYEKLPEDLKAKIKKAGLLDVKLPLIIPC